MNFQTVSTAEKLPTSDGLSRRLPRRRRDARAAAAARARLRRRPGRRDGRRELKHAAPRRQHRDHPLGQARPVADTPVGADADPRRPDHRRAQRRLDSAHTERRRPAGRLRHRRRRDADLAQRPLAGRRPRSPRPSCSATAAPATTSTGNPKPYTQLGPRARSTPAPTPPTYFGVPAGDARVPDVIGIAQYGVVYTGKQGKIAEHGGDNPQDRDVPLVVAAPGRARPLAPRRRRVRRDDPDRADDPAAARPRPGRPPGRAGRAHAGAAAAVAPPRGRLPDPGSRPQRSTPAVLAWSG